MAWVYVGTAAVSAATSIYNNKQQNKGLDRAANSQLDATQRAIDEQRRSKEEALGYFSPYSDLGGLGIDQIGFLTDSQQQYDWLQGNPLFQMGLDNANQQTSKMAAASGRLSAGDTLMQLNNNALLTAQPLIQDQKNSIGNLVNFGYGLSGAQANTALGVGNNISGLNINQGDIQAQRFMQRANNSVNRNNDMSSIFSGLTSFLG